MMDFTKLLGQVDQIQKKKSYDNDDAEFWKLSPDKAGNASAIIHFLPNKDPEDIPFVRRWHHGFKDADTGRWYIENSLTTLGENDYIAEVNTELWNTGIEANKELVRKRKRKLSYIANIYVVKDTANPENNGKVFKFKFGQKIFDKLAASMKPDEELGIEPINPFDPMGGANFMLVQKEVANWPNFDDSKFGGAAPMFGGKQKEIDAVLAQCYDLNKEVAPEKFKSYEDLKKQFLWVTGKIERTGGRSGSTGKSASAVSKAAQEEFDAGDDELAALAEMASKPATTKAKAQKAAPVMEESDDDDDAAFFKSLVD